MRLALILGVCIVVCGAVVAQADFTSSVPAYSYSTIGPDQIADGFPYSNVKYFRTPLVYGSALDEIDFYLDNATLPIDGKICLTATVDILKAIARGRGPRHAILALGYAGWGPGQLENEIQCNGWLHCDADPELVFGGDVEEKYNRALRKIGIDPGMLSGGAGHA